MDSPSGREAHALPTTSSWQEGRPGPCDQVMRQRLSAMGLASLSSVLVTEASTGHVRKGNSPRRGGHSIHSPEGHEEVGHTISSRCSEDPHRC